MRIDKRNDVAVMLPNDRSFFYLVTTVSNLYNRYVSVFAHVEPIALYAHLGSHKHDLCTTVAWIRYNYDHIRLAYFRTDYTFMPNKCCAAP